MIIPMPQRRPGFTLVEVLIYAALVGMVMVSVVLLASTAFTVRSRVRSALILEENIRFASGRIVSLVTGASGMTFPTIGTTSSTLVMTMTSPSQSPTTISLSNGTIMLAQGSSTALALTSSEVAISNLSINRVSSTAPFVRILISGGLRNPPPQSPTLTVTTTAAVRR